MTQVVRFERPPVRGVTLSVFFAQIPNLQVSHLSSLREQWRSDYPTTHEAPPRMPRFGDDDDELVLLPNEPWLFPYLTFATSSGDRIVGVQKDRFTLSWEFGEADDESRPSYPGYEHLRQELDLRLGEFGAQVEREAGGTLTLMASDCRYRNVVEGVSAADLQVGIATGWAGAQAGAHLLAADWSGFRIHQCSTEENNLCATLISIEGDHDEDPTLVIYVDRDVSDVEDSASLAGLDFAHTELIKQFVACSNPALRERWGQLA